MIQLLNSPPNPQPVAFSELLMASLQDIVSKVELQSNFGIRHPDYQPLEVPAEIIDRFQQLPAQFQNKFFRNYLCRFLYGIYYNGALRTVLARDADSAALAVNQNLENNTFLGVDQTFYQRLHESNNGEGYFDPGWQVLRQEEDGSLAVTKGGLTLHIERDRHLQPAEQSTTVGNSVAIRMPSNRVQNGFYMAVGNAGSHRSSSKTDTHRELVRVYFNFSPEGAVAVMDNLTGHLNDQNIPFSFKVLYNPSDYKRSDSGVLYFDKSHYEAVRSVLQTVYPKQQGHFQAEVPLFTKFLAPGLGLAEEPDRKFSSQESFGLNRCQIIANALLQAQQKGDASPEARLRAIIQQFSVLGLDLNRTYLNANSEDIYRPLD